MALVRAATERVAGAGYPLWYPFGCCRVAGVPGIGFVGLAGANGWVSRNEGAVCGEEDSGKAGVFVGGCEVGC